MKSRKTNCVGRFGRPAPRTPRPAALRSARASSGSRRSDLTQRSLVVPLHGIQLNGRDLHSSSVHVDYECDLGVALDDLCFCEPLGRGSIVKAFGLPNDSAVSAKFDTVGHGFICHALPMGSKRSISLRSMERPVKERFQSKH